MPNTLAERLTALERQTHGCRVAAVADDLDEAAAEALLRVVSNDNISIRSIDRELRDGGITISRDSLAKHRLQHCGCYEEIKP